MLVILPETLRKAIRAGHLIQPVRKFIPLKKTVEPQPASSKSEWTEIDSQAEMGSGLTRTLERVAAAMGDLDAAPAQFETARDVPRGGVFLALPALLATEFLRFTGQMCRLAQGMLRHGKHLPAVGADGPGTQLPSSNCVMWLRANGATCWAWTAFRRCGRCAPSWRSFVSRRDARLVGRQRWHAKLGREEWLGEISAEEWCSTPTDMYVCITGI